MQVTSRTELTPTLRAARDAAVAIHGSLLEETRRGWEREHGRVQNGAILLKLVTTEPAFAWLNPLTALIADIDEVLHDGSPDAMDRGRLLLTAVGDLLRANESGSYFQRRYYSAIQASPDVAVNHRRAMTEMRGRVVKWM